VADTVIHGVSIQNFVAEHPKTIAFAQTHQPLLKLLAKNPAVAARVGADPSLANIAAAEKAFGAKGLLELASFKAKLLALVEPYQAQLTFIEAHQAALQDLQKGSNEAPHQWQHWFYVDLGGMVVFIPLIWLTRGRWSPAAARRDSREHDERVREELARLLGEGSVKV
jgi:hypothetical protein